MIMPLHASIAVETREQQFGLFLKLHWKRPFFSSYGGNHTRVDSALVMS
jgi:hypothetical protein